MAKTSKIGNNSTSQEIVDYILNISSYEAEIEVEVKSNKNSNKYRCFMTTAYGSKSTQPSSWIAGKNITFENCKFNGYVANYSGNNLKIDKQTKINGTFVSWRKYTKVK